MPYTFNPLHDAIDHIHEMDSVQHEYRVWECACCGNDFTEGVLIDNIDPICHHCKETNAYMTYYQEMGIPDSDIMDMERQMKPVND